MQLFERRYYVPLLFFFPNAGIKGIKGSEGDLISFFEKLHIFMTVDIYYEYNTFLIF